ncbi:hypothetical protein HY991_04345 [Candidatus Micrarchaeota archaeon]|nr:hypothetical protein [Candidatus Micrarchaeota archaeon]
MKKVYLAAGVLGIVLLLFFWFLLKSAGVCLLCPLNKPFNELTNKPNTNCLADGDCKNENINCDSGCAHIAVNKNWNPICLDYAIVRNMCGYTPAPKCVDNTCQKS